MSELVAYTREGLDAVVAERVEAQLSERRSALDNPAVSLSDEAAWSAIFGAWGASVAGVAVSRDSALGVSAIWAAVNFISSTLATLPLDLYQRTGDDRSLAAKDPLHAILHDDVNEEMSSFAWRKLSMQNVLLNGRCFSFIERNIAGRIINLWPLDPARVTIHKREGRTRYVHRDGQRDRIFAAPEIIDIPWMLRSDGLNHYDPVERLKNTIGLAIGMEQYAVKFFGSGGVPPLQLVGPMESPGAIDRAATDIMAALAAAKREGRTILPMPLMHELKAIGIDPEKGQMVLARRFQLEEIARMYQLPPVFLQDLTKGTLANTEQQDLHFVKHTLAQWIKAWEQELNLKLFGPRRRDRFVEFNVDGLLRGDFKTRMEGYAKAIQNAINTPDEVRAMENWPAKGGDAEKLHIQGATVPLGEQLQRGGGAVPELNPKGGEND